MRSHFFLGILSLTGAICVSSHALEAEDSPQTPGDSTSDEFLKRGRYMVVTGHCNNCHTAGYAAQAGAIPEAKWLLGNPVGWRSKAGTVYAPNLRLYIQSITVEAWLLAARSARPRAPMPWWSLSETSSEDLVAMYWYVYSLRPSGSPAPSFLPPDQSPTTPYNQQPDLSHVN